MIQLFSSDAELFNLSELSELIISQPLIGTTVKVDGADSDLYALLTVLNMNEHKVRFWFPYSNFKIIWIELILIFIAQKNIYIYIII